jgi:hypothetical protein
MIAGVKRLKLRAFLHPATPKAFGVPGKKETYFVERNLKTASVREWTCNLP